jgi:hypothetical protein
VLREVRVVLPAGPGRFGERFLGCLAAFGELDGPCCRLRPSSAGYLPLISFVLREVTVPAVEFAGDGFRRSVDLVNLTGVERGSGYVYTPVPLPEYLRRSATLRLLALDHVGFDLPWFDGVHPDVVRLRAELAPRSAYYRFPTGEDWDFILPATPGEIADGDPVGDPDLSRVRRPKFEIVSLETCSTPIVQVDFVTDRGYPDLVRLFPEGLDDPEHRNVWVYLDTPYGLDLCLVLNEPSGAPDWSAFFARHRLR